MRKEFEFLLADNMPMIVRQAVKLIGTVEIPGPKSNTVITDWVKEIGDSASKWYSNDDVPWCGLFVAICVHRSKRTPVTGYLRAKNWMVWGVTAAHAAIGDVLVFGREGGGHVALYVGESERHYYILGGNQSNMVNITKIAKARCIAIRRPAYNIMPTTAKPMILGDINLTLSENEA